MAFRINLIVAVDSKFGISRKGIIPWRFKQDGLFFADVTKRVYQKDKKNAVIMGKDTWKELPDIYRGLKDVTNIVVSKTMTQQDLVSDNKTGAAAYLVKSLTDAYNLCSQINPGKVFIGGGIGIYSEALKNNNIDEIYLTTIQRDYECDNRFSADDFNQLKRLPIISEKTFSLQDDAEGAPKDKVDVTFTKMSNSLTIVNKEEQAYLDLLEDVLRNGHFRKTRNANVWSVFSRDLSFDLSKGFPLLTTKKMFLKGVFEELMFFLSGKTNVKELSDKGVKIWNDNTTREFLDSVGLKHFKEFDLGPLYPFQFRHYGLEYKGMDETYVGGFDQIQYCLNLLKNDPFSRRIMLTSFNPKQAMESPIYPCHSIVMQFYVDQNYKLSVQCYNRSQDAFLGNPFNISYAALFVHLFCEVVNNDSTYKGGKLSPGNLIMRLGDVHVYEDHYTQSIRQILREPFGFPQLSFSRKVNDINDFKFEDIQVTDYTSYPNIPAKMSA